MQMARETRCTRRDEVEANEMCDGCNGIRVEELKDGKAAKVLCRLTEMNILRSGTMGGEAKAIEDGKSWRDWNERGEDRK